MATEKQNTRIHYRNIASGGDNREAKYRDTLGKYYIKMANKCEIPGYITEILHQEMATEKQNTETQEKYYIKMATVK